MPGYWNSSLRGKYGFSIEQRLSLAAIPIGLFAGTGWIGNSIDDLVHGEENCEFRWRVRIVL